MTPLDEIRAMKGREVIIIERSGRERRGVLISFDLNGNAGLLISGEAHFIAGSSVEAVGTIANQ